MKGVGAMEGVQRMMPMKQFKKEFGISDDVAKRWVHIKGFPSFKLGRLWYVDIPMFMKWREKMHQQCYKYAE